MSASKYFFISLKFFKHMSQTPRCPVLWRNMPQVSFSLFYLKDSFDEFLDDICEECLEECPEECLEERLEECLEECLEERLEECFEDCLFLSPSSHSIDSLPSLLRLLLLFFNSPFALLFSLFWLGLAYITVWSSNFSPLFEPSTSCLLRSAT